MMGIVDDDEFNKELESLKNDEPSTTREPIEENKVVDINRGRGAKLETPEDIRKAIAECAIAGHSPKEIAEAFNISPSSISAYKVGATSTASYNRPDSELLKHGNSVREKITERATKKIMMALRHIDADKMSGAKLRDIAGIAKDMSAVVKNLEPRQDPSIINNNGPNYIIYTPRIRKEDEFEVVEAVNE
jgi:hypothetical protein